MSDLEKLTKRAKQLLRSGEFKISYHVLHDHPERKITAADIIECLKIGEVVGIEPKEVKSQVQYEGADRYRWFGEDTLDRVLRLIVVIQKNLIVVSAAIATENQKERYRQEDEGKAKKEK